MCDLFQESKSAIADACSIGEELKCVASMCLKNLSATGVVQRTLSLPISYSSIWRNSASWVLSQKSNSEMSCTCSPGPLLRCAACRCATNGSLAPLTGSAAGAYGYGAGAGAESDDGEPEWSPIPLIP